MNLSEGLRLSMYIGDVTFTTAKSNTTEKQEQQEQQTTATPNDYGISYSRRVEYTLCRDHSVLKKRCAKLHTY
eukprot:1907586-Amphidinium_carterae.1